MGLNNDKIITVFALFNNRSMNYSQAITYAVRKMQHKWSNTELHKLQLRSMNLWKTRNKSQNKQTWSCVISKSRRTRSR